MHVGHVATAQTTDAPGILPSLRTHSALESIIPSAAAQEIPRSRCADQLQSPDADPESHSVAVFLSAYRLTTEYLTAADRSPLGRTRSAFVFREHDSEEEDEDTEFAFGSREGEYCLLRIRIENASPHHPVRIDRIVGVQMRCQTGRVWHLKTAAGQSRPLCKEVTVLLKPTALRSGISREWPVDLENVSKRDMRLQLRIQVGCVHSNRQTDIVKTLRWRAVRSSLCPEAALYTHKWVSRGGRSWGRST